VNSRIVDEDVEATERLDGSRNRAIDVGPARNVGRDMAGPATFGLDLCNEAFEQAGGIGQVDDHDCRPMIGESGSDRPADSPGSAGDKGDSS
jgi:hypothetical protein